MKYAAIQQHIERERLQHVVFVSELAAEECLKVWNLGARIASGLRKVIEGSSDYLPHHEA